MSVSIVERDGMIVVETDQYVWGHPVPAGAPMTPLEAEKLADELRAAARKLRNRPAKKQLGGY